MQKEFTINLLVKYLYRETSTTENYLVENALSNDWELRETFDMLEKSYRELPKVTFSPKRSTIQSILGYNSEQAALEPC